MLLSTVMRDARDGGNAGSAIADFERGVRASTVIRLSIKIRVLLWLLSFGGAATAAESPAWVERLAFWAAPELKSLDSQVEKTIRIAWCFQVPPDYC